MPEGSASQPMVEASAPTTTPLAGETLLLAADHYDAHAHKVLEGIAVQLGAEITTEREKCTIMIVNVHSPKWAAEREHIKHLKTASTSLPTPETQSYHWLVLCGRAQSRLDPSNLLNETPFMVSNLTERYPVKVWVSKNVARNADESPEEAQGNTIRDLENAGAIIVDKRAYADVLIVDIQSKFYATVKKEKEARGRTWQKLAQRDWVEYCLQERTVTLRTTGEDEDELKSSDEDSFVEEPSAPIRSGTGPGRPTGKPRIEYSGQDDDFLCRWLAAFYPEGSWTSRKTFVSLAMDNERYPLADRHSSQSWQERFKKNAAAFKRRVRRFVDEGVDDTLKTAQERRKDREKRAQEAGQEIEGPEPLVAAVSEAGSPRQQSSEQRPDAPGEGSDTRSVGELVSRPSAPVKSVDALPLDTPAETSAKGASRRLVEEDPESDTPAVAVTLETQTVEVLVPETIPTNLQADNDTTRQAKAPLSEDAAPGTIMEPSVVNTRVESDHTEKVVPKVVTEAIREDIRMDTEQISTSTSAPVSVPLADQIEGSSTREAVPTTVDPNLIQVRPASELLGQPSRRDGEYVTPSPTKRSTKKRRRSEIPAEVPAGSTPLRQEILRSQENRHRTIERQARAGSSGHRASSPDKVYAFVGVPPRTPRLPSETPSAPPPGPARIPSPELTPEERQERFLRGSRIVNDVAAQYRAKMGALTRKYSIGPKEIAATTKEMREQGRASGNSGLDWDRLDNVLAEKYGK